MDNNKQNTWSEVGQMLGRAMLLLAPAVALFTIAVSWAQISDRQDRLRSDFTMLQNVIIDYKSKDNKRGNQLNERLSRLETSYEKRTTNVDRRISVLERRSNKSGAQ